MAENCPFWSGGKCAPPATDVHDCSFSRRDYDNCAVYQMVDVRRSGGSMEDAMRAAGMISPGARVVGGGGSRFGSSGPSYRSASRKKWWQFWK